MKLIPTTLLALLMAGATISPALADAAGAEDRAPTDDEQLAIAALEGLMAQPSNRALPILKKVMAGSQSDLVKRRALFVLGQINDPEAREILLQTARTNGELRGEAIRSIGISGDSKSMDALMQIYPAADEEGKKNITEAMMIAGRKDLMYQLALNAKTEEEASHAIHLLGAMGAKEELRKLGASGKQPRALVDAYGIGGDLESLLKIVQGNGDPALRVEAVRRIGIIHNDAAKSALREIYTKSPAGEIKDAALQGMLIAQDDKGVLQLYRAAKTADEKRALLRMLSLMDSDAAIEAIDATLEKK
jgi:HEAT repeat protein